MSATVDEHRSYSPRDVGFASLTVSDSRTRETDDSGRRIEKMVIGAGFDYVCGRIEPDEPGEVRASVEQLLTEPRVDVVVVSGGTGLSPRDVTVEAIVPILDREIPGFGELFRRLSFDEVGAAAMLSRATAGIAEGKAIFLLPGSPNAVGLAMEKLILPEAAHLLGQARRREG